MPVGRLQRCGVPVTSGKRSVTVRCGVASWGALAGLRRSGHACSEGRSAAEAGSPVSGRFIRLQSGRAAGLRGSWHIGGVDNEELAAIFEADQADRRSGAFDAEPEGVMERDRLRRARVEELLGQGVVASGADHFHAAMVFQHGSSLSSFRRAHELASRGRDLGDKRAAWLAAASLDRWLTTLGKPQRFGTQFQPIGGRWQLMPVDPATTDEERAAWNVPTLAENLERAERMTAENPPTGSSMPSPDDVVGVMVTREQLAAEQTLPVETPWSDEPVMVSMIGLAEIDGLVMLRIDGAGKDGADLWLRVMVAGVEPDTL